MGSIKLVVIGDCFEGDQTLIKNYKTAFCTTLVENKPLSPNQYIQGVIDNYSVTVMIDGEPYTVGIFDTAGQEDYDRLRPLSYPGTDIIIITFILEQESTFENVITKWLPEAKKFVPEAALFLVGLHAAEGDVPKNSKPISHSKLVKIARIGGFQKYFEVDIYNYNVSKTINEILFHLFVKLEKDEKKEKKVKKAELAGMTLTELMETKNSEKIVANELEKRVQANLIESQEFQLNADTIFEFCLKNHSRMDNDVMIDLISKDKDTFVTILKLKANLIVSITDEELLIKIFGLYEGYLNDLFITIKGDKEVKDITIHYDVYSYIASNNLKKLYEYLNKVLDKETRKLLQMPIGNQPNILSISASRKHFELFEQLWSNNNCLEKEDIINLMDEKITPIVHIDQEKYILPIINDFDLCSKLSDETMKEVFNTACRYNMKTAIDSLQSNLTGHKFHGFVASTDDKDRNKLMIAALSTSETVLISLISSMFYGLKDKKVIDKVLHHKDNQGRTLLKMVIDQGEPLAIARDTLIKIEREFFKDQELDELVRYFRDTIGPCKIVAKALSDEEASRSKSILDTIKIWFEVFLQFLLPFGIFLQDVVTDSLLTNKYYNAIHQNDSNFMTCNWNETCSNDPIHQELLRIPSKLDGKPCFYYSLAFILLPFGCYILEWFFKKSHILHKRLVNIFYTGNWTLKKILLCPLQASYWIFIHILWIIFWPIINLFLRYRRTAFYKTRLGEKRAKHKSKLEVDIEITTRAQMFEVSIESSFQPLLQIYLNLPCFIIDVVCNDFNDSWSHTFSRLELWAILTSVLSLAWAFTVHEANKQKGALSFSINPLARIVMLISVLMQIFGRLICLILLTYCTGMGNFWPLIVLVTCHIILVAIIDFTCGYQMKKTPLVMFNSLFNGLANIYLYNHFNSSVNDKLNDLFPIILRRILIDGLLMVENTIAVIVVWSTFGSTLPSHLCLISFFIYVTGLLLKLLYYKELHIWKVLYWKHFTSLTWVPCMKNKSNIKDEGAIEENEIMLKSMENPQNQTEIGDQVEPQEGNEVF